MMQLVFLFLVGLGFGAAIANMPIGVGLVFGVFLGYAVVTGIHLFSAINK